MKKIWYKLTHIGVHEELDMREARRISYINYIVLLAMLYIGVRIVLSLPNFGYCGRLFAMYFPAILILICNRYRFYLLAKILLFTVFVSGTSFFCYMYLGGFQYGSFVVLFSAVPWPFMLFDLKQKVLTFTSLAYLLCCFALLITLQYVHPLPVNVELNMNVVRISTTLMTIFFLILLTWYFYSSNVAEEEKLLLEKEKSEAANRAKSEFLANMSHELRTPLNAILGFSELMQRDTHMTREQRANLETIGRSGEHLLALINDVLEFSKIEAGQIDLNRGSFDLHRLLQGLEEMFKLRARQKGLSLRVVRDIKVSRYINTDQNKLRQILINLLGNAIKFTETGGITLSVRQHPVVAKTPADCNLEFEVIDTGLGISKEVQEKVFEAFFQAGDYHRTRQGTGLGLPISRKYAELLGGTLNVQSDPGKGAHFRFIIPVAQAAITAVDASHSPHRVTGLERNQPVYRLLVVEDNNNNRRLLVTLLQSVGFAVKEAVNGREAVELWKSWQPHLIWMDMRMPLMNGYEATAAIKSAILPSRSPVATKIIALSASVFEIDQRKVLECGCDDFVRKPFRDSEIFEIIKTHLGVRYLYAETMDHKSEKTGTMMPMHNLSGLIEALPLELVENLKEAVELSDAALIDQVIEEISGSNHELGCALEQMAEKFAYDKILKLVEIVQHEP